MIVKATLPRYWKRTIRQLTGLHFCDRDCGCGEKNQRMIPMSVSREVVLIPEEAFRWYLTGLVDGEGCFGLWYHKRFNKYNAYFRLVMRADERPCLESICRRVGCGRVRMSTKVGRKSVAGWHVERINDVCNVIIPHFNSYPLQMKKAKDFPIWREGALRIQAINQRPGSRSIRRITNEDNSFLAALVEQMRDVRRYDPSAAGEAEANGSIAALLESGNPENHGSAVLRQ